MEEELILESPHVFCGPQPRLLREDERELAKISGSTWSETRREACLKGTGLPSVVTTKKLSGLIMSTAGAKTLHYKRSHFATQLPVDYLYSPSHAWIAQQPDGTWRVGLTKFATRMLGEMVDHGFETQPGAKVEPGQIVGWVEGFKAISDIFCIAEGEFICTNPALKEKIGLLSDHPYGEGWLYTVRGKPDARCLDVKTYRDLLDRTIDRILEKQKNEDLS